MKRVLLTGATGFIGRHAVNALRDRGYEIHAVGRNRLDSLLTGFHEVDLFDRHAVDRAVRAIQASHLLHLAWYAEPGRFWTAPQNLDWVGASATLLRSFTEAGGRRAVIAGSCTEYEWGAERFDEMTTPCVPATLYGVAKDATRRIAEAYAKVGGISLAWGRVFFLYGPGEKSGRLVSDAIVALLAGRPFETTEGLHRRDFMDVRDVAGGFAALLDSNVEGPVNIGSGHAITVRSLVEAIAIATAGVHLVHFGARPLAPNEPAVIEANADRLLNEVGFRPTLTLAAGLSDTVRWWRQ